MKNMDTIEMICIGVRISHKIYYTKNIEFFLYITISQTYTSMTFLQLKCAYARLKSQSELR